MRLDHLAFVRRQQPSIVALAREHVEVVKPEIVHDLLQLPLAVNRPRDFGHREFFDDALGLPAVVGDRPRHYVGIDAQQIALSAGAPRRDVRLRIILLHRRLFHGPRSIWLDRSHLCWGRGIRRLIHFGTLRLKILSLSGLSLRPSRTGLHIPRDDRRGRVRAPLLALRLSLLHGLLFCLFWLWIFRKQFCRRHLQRRIRFQASLDRFVVNRIRIQLLLDPFRQTHLAHALDVARPWPIRQPVQGVQDRFIRVELRDRQALERRGLLLFLVFCRGGGGNGCWNGRCSRDGQRQIDAQR